MIYRTVYKKKTILLIELFAIFKDAEGTLKYIACQGPMTNTSVDMWQMVLEQDVVSIVMLCKIIESDKVKKIFI